MKLSIPNVRILLQFIECILEQSATNSPGQWNNVILSNPIGSASDQTEPGIS